MQWGDIPEGEQPIDGERFNFKKFRKSAKLLGLVESGDLWALWCMAYAAGNDNGVLECRRIAKEAHTGMRRLYLARK